MGAATSVPTRFGNAAISLAATNRRIRAGSKGIRYAEKCDSRKRYGVPRGQGSSTYIGPGAPATSPSASGRGPRTASEDRRVFALERKPKGHVERTLPEGGISRGWLGVAPKPAAGSCAVIHGSALPAGGGTNGGTDAGESRAGVVPGSARGIRARVTGRASASARTGVRVRRRLGPLARRPRIASLRGRRRRLGGAARPEPRRT